MSAIIEGDAVPVLNAELLGLEQNSYLQHPRMARILVDQDAMDTSWINTWHKNSQGRRQITNATYDDFEYWAPAVDRYHHQIQEGYIGGFPAITDTEKGTEDEYLHIWQYNTDIGGSIAFPIRAIRAALVTTKRESSLRIDAENISVDGVSSDRYRIPILLDTSGDKITSIISKPASTEDILCAVDELQDPLFYFGPSLVPEAIKIQPNDGIGYARTGIGSSIRRIILANSLTPERRQQALAIE